MPNNSVSNVIRMTNYVWSAVKTANNSFDFNTLVPMPEGITDVSAWRIENWGTTSNAENVVVGESDLGKSVSFNTESTVPFPIYNALTNTYPNSTFTGTYTYPDGTEYEWEYV